MTLKKASDELAAVRLAMANRPDTAGLIALRVRVDAVGTAMADKVGKASNKRVMPLLSAAHRLAGELDTVLTAHAITHGS